MLPHPALAKSSGHLNSGNVRMANVGARKVKVPPCTIGSLKWFPDIIFTPFSTSLLPPTLFLLPMSTYLPTYLPTYLCILTFLPMYTFLHTNVYLPSYLCDLPSYVYLPSSIYPPMSIYLQKSTNVYTYLYKSLDISIQLPQTQEPVSVLFFEKGTLGKVT